METYSPMITISKTKRQIRLYSLCQVVVDWCVIYAVLCSSLYIYYLCGGKYEMTVCLDLIYIPFIIVILNVISRVYGNNFFYPGIALNRVETLKRSTLSIVGGYLVLFAFTGFIRTNEAYSRLALVCAMIPTLILVPAIRNFFRYLCHRYKIFTQRVLIAGAGKEARKAAKTLTENWRFNMEVVGFLDDTVTGKDIVGSIAELPEIAAEKDVHYIIVCLPDGVYDKYFHMFLRTFCHILVVPPEGRNAICGFHPILLNYHWAMEIGNTMKMHLHRWEKNALEICIACVILPMILPLCLVIALLVKLTSPGPVFYRAKRLGQHGKEIEVLKFRTMYRNADSILQHILDMNPEMKKEWEESFKLKNDPRITPLGRFLRKTSLDELPQFINVLKGEMAIIGPRPIVREEVKYYGDDFSIFSLVKPGITGLWQVSGRSDTSYEQRVQLDVYYVANWSIWMDYYIFLNTFVAVLLRKGAA